MSQIRTLILPGLDGSPDPHWQHWWAAGDPSALIVEQFDWSNPRPEHWETELAGALLHHPGAFLVGHSLGAVLIARVLSRWPQVRAAGALLVAPAEPATSARIASFGPIPERPLGIPTTVAASRNDPWMGFARAGALASAWGANLVDMGLAGHVNVASGYGPWPQGKALRAEILARPAVSAVPAPVRGRAARPSA